MGQNISIDNLSNKGAISLASPFLAMADDNLKLSDWLGSLESPGRLWIFYNGGVTLFDFVVCAADAPQTNDRDMANYECYYPEVKVT
jgi:hypothetical protein